MSKEMPSSSMWICTSALKNTHAIAISYRGRRDNPRNWSGDGAGLNPQRLCQISAASTGQSSLPETFNNAVMSHQQPYDPYYLQQPEYGFKDRNSINTLFISGLPDDVKAREIHNLFRRRPGFDSCQLKYTGRGNQVIAFATFVNNPSAMAALHALNGVKFDPQTGSVLHIELARSNSRRKNKPGSGPYVVIDRRTSAANDAQETSSDDGDSESDEPSGNENLDSGEKGDLEIGKSGVDTAFDPRNTIAAENGQTEKTGDGVSQCSTLFIANLGPSCTEDELKQLLSQYPGFNLIKVRARGGMPVAFADFEEVEQATHAMNALQGSMLPSSDRGGMHIEYARSKMRKS